MHAQTIEIEVDTSEFDIDVARLDFLEACVMRNGGGVINAERDRDPCVDSPTFGPLPTVTMFTIQSQHVNGDGLRGAIDAAMKEAFKRGAR